jgi:hypothetical protein
MITQIAVIYIILNLFIIPLHSISIDERNIKSIKNLNKYDYMIFVLFPMEGIVWLSLSIMMFGIMFIVGLKMRIISRVENKVNNLYKEI